MGGPPRSVGQSVHNCKGEKEIEGGIGEPPLALFGRGYSKGGDRSGREEASLGRLTCNT